MKKTLREALEHAADAREAATAPPVPPEASAAADNVVAFPFAAGPTGPLVDSSGHEVDDGFLDSLRDPASVLTYTPTTDLRRQQPGQPPRVVAPPPPAEPSVAPPPTAPPVYGARDAMIERLRSPHVPQPDDASGEREYDPTRPTRRLPVLGLTRAAASPLDTGAEPDEATEVGAVDELRIEYVPLPEVIDTEALDDIGEDDLDDDVRVHWLRRHRTDCPACGHPARVEEINLDHSESRMRCLWCDHEFVLPIRP